MRAVTLIGSNGEEIAMEPPYYVGEAPSLWGAPPVEFEEDAAFAQPGTLITSMRHTARDVVLPVVVSADSALECDQAMSRLLRAVDPTRGPSRVRVQRDDGAWRELSGFAIEGTSELQYRKAFSSAVIIPIRFHAPWPYWRAVNETVSAVKLSNFATSQGKTPYRAALPYRVSLPYRGVTVAGTVNLNLGVAGDVEVWPRFEITGPASSVELVNLHPQSHQSMTFETALEVGEVLTIETHPDRRMIAVDDDPAWQFQADNWEWWRLYPGPNPVVINIQSLTSATAIKISYVDEWLTA